MVGLSARPYLVARAIDDGLRARDNRALAVWVLAILVAGPLMAALAVNFAIIVSSRVSDPRVAEQISAVIVVPLLALVFGQIAGIIVLNVWFMLYSIGVLALIDVGLIYLGARLFQRETILTKWK